MDLLICDDEKPVRFGIRKALGKLGLALGEAGSGEEALGILEAQDVAVVLLDFNMPGLTGMETLDKIRERGPEAPLVIMLTAFGSERHAVEAMKRGAFDYMTKPYDLDELRLTIERALSQRRLSRENRVLKARLEELHPADEVIGRSEAVMKIATRIQKAAPADVTVLILGESGTGKELAARAIHKLSPRASKPFVSTNSAAIPEDLIESELFGHEKGAFTGAAEARPGKFELADGGTLFLDEIGDMSIATQAKVLRALQERSIQRLGSTSEKKVDVRLIAATHQDLPRRIEQGLFREDLYYRLKVVELTMPPLRERREDIPILAEHFMNEACTRHALPAKHFDPELMRALALAPWKGNVRQLRNQIEAAVVMADGETLTLADFEDLAGLAAAQASSGKALPDLDFSLGFREAKRIYVERFEKAFLEGTLERCGGNISKAARLLDMHRQSLQQKLRSLGISAGSADGKDEA